MGQYVIIIDLFSMELYTCEQEQIRNIIKKKKNVYFSNMKKIIKHYSMTDRLIVTRGYLILHTCMHFNSIICVFLSCSIHVCILYDNFHTSLQNNGNKLLSILPRHKREFVYSGVLHILFCVVVFFYLLDSVLCPYVVSFSGLSIFVLPLRYSLTFIQNKTNDRRMAI